MLEAVLVVYSAFIARVEKENHTNIFGVVYHIGYMIILYGNIPHKHIMKTKKKYMVNATIIYGVRSWQSNFYWTNIFFVLSTGRRKDQGLELQLHALQNLGHIIVQAQV